MTTKTDTAKRPVEILIVEDSQTQAEKLRFTLEGNGYLVRHAKNGKQAMDYLSEYHPALVISDIIMPQMDGYELCKNIKSSEHTCDIPVILMTSLTGTEEVMESLVCGADSFITKPYSESYLLTQIEGFFINKLLPENESLQRKIEIGLTNQNGNITIDSQRIINLLLSTYEAAIEKKKELIETQDELVSINENLEDIVKEKTIELITENEKRKKSENELLEAQKIAHIGSFEYDAKSGRLTCTNEGLSICGVNREEFSETPDAILQYIHSDDRELILKVIVRAINEKSVDESTVRIIRPNGEKRIVNVRFLPELDSIGKNIRITGTVQDITDQKEYEEKLIYLSYHDQLTGLYNRRYFEEEIIKIDHEENYPISIIMLDINGLKLINDSFGHAVGDDVIIKSAKTIKNCCRPEDISARLGGDEFAILLPRTDIEDASIISNTIKKLISEEKVFEININISCGVDTKKNSKQSIIEILQNSENYMYRHKLYEHTSTKSRTIELIMNTLFEKSNRESMHSRRVSDYCKKIASEMNVDKNEINKIEIAGLLHDIGKIGIHENILNKSGKLNEEEWNEMKKHSEASWRILSSSVEYAEVARYIYEHHEKLDGSGYPRGLKGDEISIEAKIIGIADAYDAMTSIRTYKEALSELEAIKEIKRCSGTQFDPKIAKLFVEKVLGKEW